MTCRLFGKVFSIRAEFGSNFLKRKGYLFFIYREMLFLPSRLLL